MKRKRVGPPHSLTPHICFVLAVDPGSHSGWAIFNHQGHYVDSGSCSGFDLPMMLHVMGGARFFADAVRARLVLVMEKPPRAGMPFKGRSVIGAATVIATRKIWQQAWQEHCRRRRELGERVPVRYAVDVYPQQWRGAVLGMCSGELLPAAEDQRVRALAGRLPKSRDEIAAVLIGAWGCRAGAVGQVLLPVARKVRVRKEVAA